MSDTDRDVDFDAIKSSDIFDEARDRLCISRDANTSVRARMKEDAEFRRGKGHWDLPSASVSEQSIELTINLTDALVRRVTNNMREQRPRGKAHPVADGADITKADLINGIGRHVETRSEASVAYDTAGDHAVTMGEGYCRLISEYVSPDSFDQDLRILPIMDPFTVYMDPASIMPSGSDANWCLITGTMRRTEFKRLYPGAKDADFAPGDEKGHKDWDDKELIRVAEYFRIREVPTTLYRITGPDGKTQNVTLKKRPTDEELAETGAQILDERESSKRQVEWFKLNGVKVVGRVILPGDSIPVFRCIGNQMMLDGQIDRWGMVDPMKDAQRMVDYGEVAKIRRLGLTPQSPWVGAEGQFDGHPEWDQANTDPHMKLIYKPVTVTTAQGEVLLPPPQRQPPAQLEAGFSEFTQQMRSNLLAIAGMPNDPGQDMNGQVVSGKAIQRRQSLSDKSHIQYYDNQTLMIAQVWRVMLQWIPYYFSEERQQRIIGEDHVPKMVTLNEQQADENGVITTKNDLSTGRYDVVMDTGPGYDTKREEGSDALIGLLSVAPLAEVVAKVGADLIFRSIDHPYMQELADRISAQTPEGLKKIMEEMPPRARALIQALYAQTQQLQQANQKLESDLKLGLTKQHLIEVGKAHDVQMDAQVRREDSLTKAQTARHVEEIKAGTALLKEAMAHGHDVRMAEHEAAQLAAQGASNGGG